MFSGSGDRVVLQPDRVPSFVVPSCQPSATAVSDKTVSYIVWILGVIMKYSSRTLFFSSGMPLAWKCVMLCMVFLKLKWVVYIEYVVRMIWYLSMYPSLF